MRIAEEEDGRIHKVGGEAEVEQILRVQNSAGMNSFTIFEAEGAPYPMLIVMANQNYAYLGYFDTEGGSYQSVGHLPELDPHGHTTFYFGSEYLGYDNMGVVSFDAGLRAAKEFVSTKQLPGCIEWIKAT